MNFKTTIIISIISVIFFSLNLSFASININYEDDQDHDVFFLPDCEGLLPDNYEYMEFLEKIAIGLVMQDTKSGIVNAEKIYTLLSIRNSSLLSQEDQFTKNTAKQIDNLVAENLCAFAYGRNKQTLWNGSPVFLSWVEKNVDNLINEIKDNLRLHIQVMKEIELSQKKAAKLKRKINTISNKGEREANRIISKLKR